MPIPVTALTSLGISAEDAATIAATPETDAATFDAAPYAEKVRSNYKTQFENDPAFFSDATIEKLPIEIRKRMESSQFGRAAKIVTDKLLKGLGMTEADYADLPDEQKEKIELLIPAIADRYTKTKAGDKQLQADLIAARKQLEAYGPDYETGIETKYKTQAETTVSNAIFNAALIGELSAIPGLKIAAGDIAKTANDILQSKYGFERVGDYSVELRQKDNKSMKVLKANSSHELTLREALTEIATERGWIEKPAASGNGSGIITTVAPTNGVLNMMPPHLQDRIGKKIAAEKV